MEQSDNHPELTQTGDPPPDAPIKRPMLSTATLRLLIGLGAVLVYANIAVYDTHGLCSMPRRGWPFSVYSNFYGWESYDWPNLLANLVTAVLMLLSTGWIIEGWVQHRFRFTLPALFGSMIIAGALAAGSYLGIISFSQRRALGEDSEVARCFQAVVHGLLGRQCEFRIYGDYWWEYIPFSILIFGIACILYAGGKVLLLPFKILTPGPFRWR